MIVRPRWAWVAVGVLLAVPAWSYGVLPWWGVAAVVVAPVAAFAMLTPYPLGSLGSLGLCVVASLAVAPAFDAVFPVWTLGLLGALAVVAYLAGRIAGRLLPAAAVAAAGPVLELPFVSVGTWSTGVLLVAVVVAAPWALGRGVRQQAILVRLQERTRIARDMHDTLGHELSLLALQAGALELATDGAGSAAAAEVRSGAAQAISRLSEIITVMRGDPPDVAARASRAGLEVTVDWDGPVRDRAIVDRLVQEALTNAMKHAPGQAVRVQVSTVDDGILVTVTNPVVVDALSATAHEAGGTAEARFVVEARLP